MKKENTSIADLNKELRRRGIKSANEGNPGEPIKHPGNPSGKTVTGDVNFDVEKYNQEIRRWQNNTYKAIKGNLSKLNIGIKGKTALLKSVRSPSAFSNLQKRVKKETILRKAFKKAKLKENYGEIDSIGFKMPRHGIYISKGVSKGHKVGNPRRKKDWFNSLMDPRIQQIADIVLEYKGDQAVLNSNSLKISG
ncbi:MAG: hypothetical protein U9Q69_00150 [Nanoarchaeota archaeon]|nr:hypothetical protein [Nanoarchaeota archaeon]